MKHLSKCALHIVHVHICFINVFTLRGRAQTKVLTGYLQEWDGQGIEYRELLLYVYDFLKVYYNECVFL